MNLISKVHRSWPVLVSLVAIACGSSTPPVDPINGTGGVGNGTGSGGSPSGAGGSAAGAGGQAQPGAGGSGGSLMPSGGGPGSGGGPDATGGGTGGEVNDARDAHFKDWPANADPAAVGKKLAQVFLAETPSDAKHYKVACAWYGALVVASKLNETALVESLIAEYASYKNTWQSLLSGTGHVDENVFGIVPLEISMHSEDESYLAEGLSIADHQVTNINSHKRFAIDDMFMITGLQVQAYRASGDVKYLNLAASVMVEYLNRLQQDDGMFFHHEDFHHKWGRGNGWFAAGMAELIRELPMTHQNYAAVREGYEKMMEGLLSYQIKDGNGAGLWKQIVDSDDNRNWPETSGSAMFTYALISGVRAGWLEADTYGPAARAGWLALVSKINAEGRLQDISDWAYKPASHQGGPSYAGDEENYYFERPKLTGDNHGQAPVMWSAGALL